VLYAGFDAGGVYKSIDAGATWTPMNAGMRWQRGLQSVLSLAVDPRQPATVYAATYSFVFRSTNGRRWSKVGGSNDSGPVTQVLIDPLRSSTLYAVVLQSGRTGILKSLDGGATWQEANSGLPPFSGGYEQLYLAQAPDVPDTLFLSIKNAYEAKPTTWKSSDGAATWSASGPGGIPLAAGPGGQGVAGNVRSTDGGTTWTDAAQLSEAPQLLTADPVTVGRVYAATETQGIFRSLDTGATWQASSRGLTASDPRALAFDPHGVVLYTTLPVAGVLRGPAWSLGTGMPQEATFTGFMPLAFDPLAVYAGWYDGFGRSFDGGATWQVLESYAAGDCVGFSSLAADPFTPATLYATGFSRDDCSATATPLCPVFKTTDGGVTWRCLPIDDDQAGMIVADPKAGTLYLTSVKFVGPLDSWKLQKSSDGGATWTRIDAGLRKAGWLGPLAVDPTNPARLFIAAQRGLYQTTDGGRSWFFSGRGLPVGALPTVQVIAIDPQAPQNVYVGGYLGVFRSADGGRSWRSLAGLPAFAPPLLIVDPMHAG
ncbi:MAG TPA: hypothetical protein VGE98_07120, partial [Thermoanaerobaculia bacterium]